MRNPLLDKEFLLKLDETRERQIYVRLVALTFDEHPLETIEGRVTQGSLNIDGKSAVRRTCNLTLVANDLNINDFYWGTKTKFSLEIGVKNNINKEYPDIIWFPFGKFLISTFNTSQNVNSYTITVTGKDKMCLLNGELGGAITSLTVDFGKYDQYDAYGNKITKSYEIKQIIRDMVHQYGNEPFHNIIINDLDDLGLMLKEYRGDIPMYLFREETSDEFLNMTLDDSLRVTILENNITRPLKNLIQTGHADENVGENIPFNFDLRNSFTAEEYAPTRVKIGNSNKIYLIAKIEYGDTPGYELTDLTYPGDLIASVGEPITSILDKIVKMLGNFEYFYDVDGRFIFQKKPTYIQTSWDNLISDEDGTIYGENAALTSALSYSFEDSKLVQSFSNTPNLTNLKNDFSVWGTRTSATGAEIPIHMRYAIDKKPTYYKTIDGFIYSTEDLQLENFKRVDWREIIYQMAIDYRRYNHEDGFEALVALNNLDYYPTGKTGYEQYYIDLEGFWRQLYNPDYKVEYPISNYVENADFYRYVKGFEKIKDENEINTEYAVCEIDNAKINNKGEIIKEDANDFYITKYYYLDKLNQFDVLDDSAKFKYWIKKDSSSFTLKGAYYDKNYTYLKSFSLTRGAITQLSSIPNNAYYVRFTLPSTIVQKNKDYFYFKTFKADTEYEKYYCVKLEKNSYKSDESPAETMMVKYIDTLNFEEMFDKKVYSKRINADTNKVEYIETIHKVDLSSYMLYKKVGDDYKRLIDTDPTVFDKKTKVFLKTGNNTYTPVEDLVHVANYKHLADDNDFLTKTQDFYMYKNENDTTATKVSLSYNGDIADNSLYIDTTDGRKIKNLKQINFTDWSKIVDTETNEAIYNKAVYIYVEKDIENKVLYIYDNSIKDYVSLNNAQSSEDKTNVLYAKMKNGEYYRIPEMINVDKSQLYYEYEITNDQGKKVKVYDLFIKLLTKPDIQLYKKNESQTLYLANNPNYNYYWYYVDKTDPENRKYKKYLYSPVYTFIGRVNPYIKTQKTEIVYYTRDNKYNVQPTSDELMPGETIIPDLDSKITEKNRWWNDAIIKNPETLNFWFDFLDVDGELEQFSVPVIGDRPKPLNDSNVKAIYFRDVPNVIFVDSIPDNIHKKSGYSYIQLQPGMQHLFVTSGQGKNAKDVVEENLYNHAYCAETISATTVPVYYLEPNTRIFIRDDNSKINGEYILNSMSISLTYNGMMNISANKAIENILY